MINLEPLDRVPALPFKIIYFFLDVYILDSISYKHLTFK